MIKLCHDARPKRKGTTHSDDDSSWGAGSIDLSERVGGMNKQINEIFRRVFASRDLHPDVVTKLKIRHTRGMLLYGPPGTSSPVFEREARVSIHHNRVCIRALIFG